MRKIVLLAAVFSGAAILLSAFSWAAASTAAEPYYRQVTVEGKAVTEVVAIHTVEGFWRPGLAAVSLLAGLGLMALASSKQTRLVPGTLIGLCGIGLAVLFGNQLLSNGDVQKEAFWAGMWFLVLSAMAAGVLAAAIVAAAQIGAKTAKPNPKTTT